VLTSSSKPPFGIRPQSGGGAPLVVAAMLLLVDDVMSLDTRLDDSMVELEMELLTSELDGSIAGLEMELLRIALDDSTVELEIELLMIALDDSIVELEMEPLMVVLDDSIVELEIELLMIALDDSIVELDASVLDTALKLSLATELVLLKTALAALLVAALDDVLLNDFDFDEDFVLDAFGCDLVDDGFLVDDFIDVLLDGFPDFLEELLNGLVPLHFPNSS
jgi:hypothetical protein